MSKLKVSLIVGGAVIVAGYVYRKPLGSVATRARDYAHGFVNDVLEDLAQQRYNGALERHDRQRDKAAVWKDDGSVDEFLSHPETGSVHVRPIAQ